MEVVTTLTHAGRGAGFVVVVTVVVVGDAAVEDAAECEADGQVEVDFAFGRPRGRRTTPVSFSAFNFLSPMVGLSRLLVISLPKLPLYRLDSVLPAVGLTGCPLVEAILHKAP